MNMPYKINNKSGQPISSKRSRELHEHGRRPTLQNRAAQRNRESLDDRARRNRRKREEEDARQRAQRRKLMEEGRRLNDVPPNPPKDKTPHLRRWRQSIDDLKGVKSKSDTIILQIALLLLSIGLVMVLSAGSYRALVEFGDPYYYFKRQFLFALLGLIVMFIMSIINVEWIRGFSGIGFIIVFVLLIAVFLGGDSAMGARRWIEIGGIRFSPSDLAKPIGVIYIAHYLDIRRKTMQQLNGYVMVIAVVMIFPIMIAIEDLGTAMTLFATFFAMLMVAGAPFRYAGGTLALGGLAAGLAILIEPYRVSRIIGFLDPFSAENMQGEGWQLVQSLYALGAGGLTGVGLGNSGQKMMYLPEMHTDFIFSVLSEELGFVGGALVVFLFVVFAWRGYWTAMQIREPFKSLTMFGLVTVIVVQAMINIGVAVGVLPVTGITLPFISYGGTSLVVTLATIGFILNLSRYVEPTAKSVKRKE